MNDPLLHFLVQNSRAASIARTEGRAPQSSSQSPWEDELQAFRVGASAATQLFTNKAFAPLKRSYERLGSEAFVETVGYVFDVSMNKSRMSEVVVATLARSSRKEQTDVQSAAPKTPCWEARPSISGSNSDPSRVTLSPVPRKGKSKRDRTSFESADLSVGVGSKPPDIPLLDRPAHRGELHSAGNPLNHENVVLNFARQQWRCDNSPNQAHKIKKWRKLDKDYKPRETDVIFGEKRKGGYAVRMWRAFVREYASVVYHVNSDIEFTNEIYFSIKRDFATWMEAKSGSSMQVQYLRKVDGHYYEVGDEKIYKTLKASEAARINDGRPIVKDSKGKLIMNPGLRSATRETWRDYRRNMKPQKKRKRARQDNPD